MAVSIVTYTGDGSTSQYIITFDYIDRTHVSATVGGTAASFTFINDTTIQFNTAPASAAEVKLVRQTPVAALVDFTDGSTLFEADLDLAHRQNRLLAEESRDRADNAITTLNNNITNINTAAASDVAINTVAAGIANVNNVATNMAEVLLADTNAATATTKASEASASASTASTQAGISTTKAGIATTQAGISTTKAGEAAASASSASGSASTATTQAGISTTKAGEAAASASTATTQAGTATTQAGISTTKAGEASTSASNAASSASSAQASKDAALAALDSFDDRYLGQKASDPALDNDGNALVAGALYFNTTDDAMKVYEGSSWVVAYASLAGTLLIANNLSDIADAAASRTNLGLGTAATTASTDYATAAQGTKADTAVPTTATTGQANLPSGTTAQRTGSPATGALRFNSTDTSFEGYNGTEWGSIGGGAADGIFYENDQAVASSYTIVAAKNAMTAGPITINSGVTVTIETGGRWVVL